MIRRRFLKDLETIAAGGDPKAVIRDPAVARNVRLPVADREGNLDGQGRRVEPGRVPNFPFQAGMPEAVKQEFGPCDGRRESMRLRFLACGVAAALVAATAARADETKLIMTTISSPTSQVGQENYHGWANRVNEARQRHRRDRCARRLRPRQQHEFLRPAAQRRDADQLRLAQLPRRQVPAQPGDGAAFRDEFGRAGNRSCSGGSTNPACSIANSTRSCRCISTPFRRSRCI